MNTQPFTLNAKWTIDKKSIEDDMMSNMSKAIAAEIDFEILSNMLVGMGWSKVVLSPMSFEDSRDVDIWTATQLKGKFHTMGLVWIFERPDDANWFALRWLG